MEIGGKNYELGFGYAVKIFKHFQLISKCLMWHVLVDIQDCGGYCFCLVKPLLHLLIVDLTSLLIG